MISPDGGPVTALPSLLLTLAGTLVATKLLGDLARRVGQPAVLGELIAGVLLGPSLLGIFHPGDPVLAALGELGVLLLLFQIGLHTHLASVVRVGGAATAVALVGVGLPFGLGLAAMQLLGVSGLAAVVCCAALTATSVGISARILADLGHLETTEGRIVLGAAVLDDVVGLIILSIVAALAGGAVLSAAGVARTTGIAVGFLILALGVGRLAVPWLTRMAAGIRVPGALGALALALALAMGGLATFAGSAAIIGAFAAGLLLHDTAEREEIEQATTALGHFFVPFFFAGVGAALDVRSLADGRVLAVGAVLTAAGIAGKFLAGYVPWWVKGRHALIGAAMVPRGEVGLIFAQLGLATGALDAGLFSAVLLMVMATTFVAPPWIAALSRRAPGRTPDALGEGGLDELVSGPR